MTTDERDAGSNEGSGLPIEHPPGPLSKMPNDPQQLVDLSDSMSSGMITPAFEQLKQMSDDQLKAAYDRMTPVTAVGPGFLLDELQRRDAGRTATRALRVSTGSFVVAVLALLVTVLISLNREPVVSAPEITVLLTPVLVQPGSASR